MSIKKNLLLSVICFAIFQFGVSAADEFSNISVSISTSPTPIYFIQNVGNVMNASSNNKWILFEIKFDLNNRDKEARTPISNLTRNYSIKIETIIAGSKNLYYLSNTTAYSPVSLSPRTKYALFLIPPQIVNTLIPNSRGLKKSYLQKGIQTKISFIQSGKPVTEYYYPKNSSTEKAFNNIPNSNNVIKLNRGLLNRTQTPWAGINFDKYELTAN